MIELGISDFKTPLWTSNSPQWQYITSSKKLIASIREPLWAFYEWLNSKKYYHSLENPRASCNTHSFPVQTGSCEKAHFIIKSYGIKAVDGG